MDLSMFNFYEYITCIEDFQVSRLAQCTMLLLLLSHFSPVQLCATPQTAAHQAPPPLGFSRQEYWSGLPLPSPHWRLQHMNFGGGHNVQSMTA